MITGDFVNGLHLMQGLSTDNKPTATSENTFFLEQNTGKVYYFSGGSWTQAGDDVALIISAILGGGRDLPVVTDSDDGKVLGVENGAWGLVDSSVDPTAIADAVTDWLDENITEPTEPVVDSSLTVEGAAADAKAVGQALADVITEDIKTVLLDIAAHVAWDDANGQSRYDALEAALYPETHLVSITASYDQDHPIYDTDSLEAVITTINYDLTVVANYSDGTTETLSSSDYAISGTVEVGASVPFTVTYEGKTDTINVLILESGALPTGYTKKDYIKFNANAGTNIGGRNDNNAILIDDISLSAEYTYEFELKVPSNASSSASPLFGARTGGTGEKLFALFYTPSTTKLGYWINGTDSTTTITGVSTSAVNTIKIKPVGASTTYPDNVVIELNGTEYNTGSTSTATLTSYLAFFKYAISSTQVASWDRYYYGEQYGKFVVKNGSTTVYNFVPAYNGTYYGYYETVNSKWYPGIGSPEKILGGDWS